jgi:tagatose 1,6-diphosphate aldolase
MRFQFLDPGPLIDHELVLVAPAERHIEEVLVSCQHPLTARDAPNEKTLTRQKLLDFLNIAPGGKQPADVSRGWVPAYHFWLRVATPITATVGGEPSVPISIAGGLGLRIGNNKEIELYSGNIGYHVYPPARGHHYAERACRLVMPLARRHGLTHLWITTNPDNVPSRRTCERLGAQLIDTVTIPKDHPFRSRGETAKCRYLLRL